MSYDPNQPAGPGNCPPNDFFPVPGCTGVDSGTMITIGLAVLVLFMMMRSK